MNPLLFLLPALFCFSACVNNSNLPLPEKQTALDKIKSNQTAALAAQDEYKKLQAKRSRA